MGRIKDLNPSQQRLLLVKQQCMCCGGCQVVSVLAFYFDDPSSNPAEAHCFYVILCLNRTKERPGFAPFLQEEQKCKVQLRHEKQSKSRVLKPRTPVPKN